LLLSAKLLYRGVSPLHPTPDREEILEVEHILLDFGVILGAGLVSQFLATFLRIPEMIVLVAVGALIGPSALGIVENPLNGVGAQLIFTVGVAMILFHGGVGISLRVISRTAVGLGLLVLPGVAITAFIIAVVVAPIFGVSLLVALMIGAVLASTDPAIIIPLFERLGLRPKVFTFIFPVGSGATPIVATIFLFSIAVSVTLSPVV
jgi:cell volume regulation protein A